MNLNNISHNYCQWPTGVSWTRPNVRSLRSTLQSIHTKKWCLGLSSSPPVCILISYTFVFPDPRVWHDLDQSSCFKDQGHCTHISKIFVRPITPFCHAWSTCYLTQRYCDFQSESYRQGRGQSSHISIICFWVITFDRYNVNVTCMGIILYTIVVHDRGVLLLGVCPIRTCPVFHKVKQACNWTLTVLKMRYFLYNSIIAP